MTTEEFWAECGPAGRNSGPCLLSTAVGQRVISSATLAEVIGDIWTSAEFPEQSLGRAEWARLFRMAGFTIDGQLAELPAGPVKLWRGSAYSRRRGMAWTTNLATAKWFAAREKLFGHDGQLWEVAAPAGAILCVNNDYRDEAEYVLDTRGLRITPAEVAA